MLKQRCGAGRPPGCRRCITGSGALRSAEAAQAHLQPASDVRPLFLETDRSAMEWRFDLWIYDDVRANAAVIFDRLVGAKMPCDESWDEEQIAVLRHWIDDGMKP